MSASPVGLAAFFVLLGLLLTVAEVFIPSMGVLGVLAACSFLASLWFGFTAGSTAGYLTLVTIAVLLPVALRLAFRALPYTPFGRVLLLEAPGKEVQGSGAGQRDQTLVGREGRTATELRPAGIARIDGQRIDVFAESGHIGVDRPVRVVEVKANRVVVRLIENERPDVAGEP